MLLIKPVDSAHIKNNIYLFNILLFPSDFSLINLNDMLTLWYTQNIIYTTDNKIYVAFAQTIDSLISI